MKWQEGVLTRLNELVRGTLPRFRTAISSESDGELNFFPFLSFLGDLVGTEYEGLSVLQTVKQTASDPNQVLVFNYASEALNNSFFLNHLVRCFPSLSIPCHETNPSPLPQLPEPLENNSSTHSPLRPNESFFQSLAQSSLPTFAALVSHFSSHVAGLHPSSGAYVWLVMDQDKNLGVVGTYAGGTVLVKERMQTVGDYSSTTRILGEVLEPLPEATEESAKVSPWTSVPPPSSKKSKSKGYSSSAGAVGPDNLAGTMLRDTPAGAGSRFRAGEQVYPLACLSVHPHCYLEDYGVWGRDEYVQKWWSHVDWRKVEETFKSYASLDKRA